AVPAARAGESGAATVRRDERARKSWPDGRQRRSLTAGRAAATGMRSISGPDPRDRVVPDRSRWSRGAHGHLRRTVRQEARGEEGAAAEGAAAAARVPPAPAEGPQQLPDRDPRLVPLRLVHGGTAEDDHEARPGREALQLRVVDRAL